MYRIGWPLWKLFAKAGIPLHFMLTIHFDEESKSFWADSPDVDGLVVAGETLEEVRREAEGAAELLLELQLNHTPKLSMRPQWGMDDILAQA